MRKDRILIVYSSHLTPDENARFDLHISNTIGVKHTVRTFINYNQFSLTQCYNIALSELRMGDFPNNNEENTIIVFCHNDILFKTKNWGRKILKHFNESSYSILGVAGTTDVPKSGKWWEEPHHMCGIVEHEHEGKQWESKYSRDFKNDIVKTAIVDGLFFCVDPETIKKRFNEKYTGFHFYDVSFSFENSLAGVNVGVIFDVRILHKSIGMTNEKWEENRVLFAAENNDNLPFTVEVNEIPGYFERKIKISTPPKVSVIIPTKNNFELIADVVDSFMDLSTYSNYEIIIADTGSVKEILDETKDYMSQFDNVNLIEYDYYNFAKINNDVVKNHVGDDTELILFCNNDVMLVNDALSLMVDTYLKNKVEVGTIGARLLFENNRIQHSGIYLKIVDQRMKISHLGFKTFYSFFDKPTEVLGNTGALLMINKNLFEELGMFNEEYNECFEDVELNLECVTNGKKNIIVGNAIAYHYESETRSDNLESQGRMKHCYKVLGNYINANFNNLKKVIAIE